MRWFATIALALLAGFSGAALWELTGMGGHETRDYLLENPEVLTEAAEELNRRQMVSAIEPLRGELETPFPGALLGNPAGTVTLVKFTDYACGYCRQSHADVLALVAANPDLKVVVRDYPVLSPSSVDAARMALAAAQQGKFAQFHDAMFAAGSPNDARIEAAAKTAGLDLARARSQIAAGAFDGALQNNVFLAQSIGVNSTPSWVIGERILVGAQDVARMSEAIEAARES